MGKKSLIKSTSKKNKPEKSENGQIPADEAKSTAKPAANGKLPKNDKASVKGKSVNGSKKAEPVSEKDLILKKFEPLSEIKVIAFSETRASRNYTAPPFFSSDDPQEIDRIKSVLSRKYSKEELIAAAEKAAAEKAAAEKAAVEKAAAEKAAAEKAAAEKAAAEKAAAEKAAAEKAAAEKAAAEKAAAEKAAAEKAAAEKAAAEKAAAEKAAAEKAAAEKAAAEKAAAEKAAAEKAAAEKAAAERTHTNTKPKKPSSPQEKVMKISLGAFALLILYLIGVSYSNRSTYHLKENNGSVELWQGIFSPKGEERVLVLPGARLPENLHTTGSEKKIFPFVVDYYLNRADALYDVTGTPDFRLIEDNLENAEPYAVTPELMEEINARQNMIDYTVLLNKAETAINNNTPESLNAALLYLQEARTLDIDTAKKELAVKKMETVQALLADFQSIDEQVIPDPEPAPETTSPEH